MSKLQTLWSGGQAHSRVRGTELAVTGSQTQQSIVVLCPVVTRGGGDNSEGEKNKTKTASFFHPFVYPSHPAGG